MDIEFLPFKVLSKEETNDKLNIIAAILRNNDDIVFPDNPNRKRDLMGDNDYLLNHDHGFAKPRTDTDDFPVGSKTSPIGVMWIEDQEVKFRYLKLWAKGRASQVAEFLKGLKKKKIKFKVIGTWPGEWSSDMFEFDPDCMISKLEEYAKNGFCY
jgi:hypothetical protein